MFYQQPGDESAEKLKALRESEGIDAVLRDVCKLDLDGALAGMIREKVDWLRKQGWIHE